MHTHIDTLKHTETWYVTYCNMHAACSMHISLGEDRKMLEIVSLNIPHVLPTNHEFATILLLERSLNPEASAGNCGKDDHASAEKCR